MLDSPAALAAALAVIGCVSPEGEAALLLSTTRDPSVLAGLVERRAQGVPVEVLVGYADFAGVRVVVRPGVFVPRPRSALLARTALTRALEDPPAVVADVCCGTGALAAVLASALPDVRVLASDVDPTAVACARENAAAYGFEVSAGDLCDALPGSVRGRLDLLVANVPHVPTSELPLMPRDTRAHEPSLAHDGGPDGLSVLLRLAAQAPAWLAPAGALLVELADRQADPATVALQRAGLAVARVRDADERTTVLVAQRSAASTTAADPSR